MGVIVTKTDDDNVELTNKINADLRAKVSETQQLDSADPEFEKADYLEGYKETGKFSWVWFILIGLAVASLIFIILL